jgi:molecular chaperone GrpE (heat shock protein)
MAALPREWRPKATTVDTVPLQLPITQERQRGPSMNRIVQTVKNPNQLTRSENRQIDEAVAGLNAEFENLRQRLRGQVEEADVDGAEYTALLMATTMSQIAVMQGAQRGDPKVISSMRKKGFL